MYQAQTVSGSKSGRKHDETFLLSIIPNLVTFIKAKIPNLQAMAVAAAADKNKNKNKDIKIYNEDTCTEYHDLLCELLQRFHKSLCVLKSIRESAISAGVTERQTEATTGPYFASCRVNGTVTQGDGSR
jgi:hypothetical protein